LSNATTVVYAIYFNHIFIIFFLNTDKKIKYVKKSLVLGYSDRKF